MTEKMNAEQVEDDFDLLCLMMKDTASADAEYRPTQYWKQYEDRFLPELRKLGLHDFRKRRKSVLSSFGATDLGQHIDVASSRIFSNRLTKRLPGWSAVINLANALVRPCESRLLWRGISLPDLFESTYQLVATVGKLNGARPLEELSVSLVGKPEEVFTKDGRNYTTSSLYYYLRYAYCCRFTCFDNNPLIVELGSGCGKQVEVIKKLHPGVRFLLFDIPPQLFVCEQFLKAVFPDQVVSYRETRERAQLGELKPGGIHILPNWKFPDIQSISVDLFWNAASFQEMEPNVVENYLRFVRVAAKEVFLQEKMAGKEVARRHDEVGVKQPTTLKEYEAGLKGFTRVDLSPCTVPPLFQRYLYGYFDSFWKRSDG